jgi:uncharacterized flavoprotein (TIGR03862 family)
MSQANAARIVIVGGGPAGLFAAETAATQGAQVRLYEAKASVGRKLLVAGRGGLNLTHGETMDAFVKRYCGKGMPPQWWADCLKDFSPAMLRAWAEELGIATFEQRTGRVYPRVMKAAPLLRRWVERLRALGVEMHMKHRLAGIIAGEPLRLLFETAEEREEVVADAAVLALGGASWPITGSDGRWTEWFQKEVASVQPWQSANCGWEVAWPREIVPLIEGKPLKNAAARAGAEWARGELMLTRYGIEGGIVYQLGAALRAMECPVIEIDLKPDSSEEQLLRKVESVRENIMESCAERWRLSHAAKALLQWRAGEEGIANAEGLAHWVKRLRLPLQRPRPIDEAISSAGGVAWSELDADLSVRSMHNLFVAGEMIDWEAPTGGYLMQGCFASGRRAALGALAFCSVTRRVSGE